MHAVSNMAREVARIDAGGVRLTLWKRQQNAVDLFHVRKIGLGVEAADGAGNERQLRIVQVGAQSPYQIGELFGIDAVTLFHRIRLPLQPQDAGNARRTLWKIRECLLSTRQRLFVLRAVRAPQTDR